MQVWEAPEPGKPIGDVYMLIDYRRKLTPEERKHYDAIKELLADIEPTVQELLDDHRRNSQRWYPHEFLPWGEGVDFNDVPWSAEQNSLRPDVVVALETNLLTEDNLPYYHAQVQEMVEPGGPFQEWNRLWTAEEGAHAAAIRDYFYLRRVMNPKEIEDSRLAMMEAGWDRDFADPLEVFAYTATQELATRISHLRAGQRADEPIALKLMSNISRDENFHFIFYRGVVKAALERAPELMLPAINAQLYSFEMPGVGMNQFELRKAIIADAGIYGTREHRDMVIKPVLNFWEIDQLEGLPPEVEKVQERILRLIKVLDRMVERQERKPQKSES